jgi:hypothetical protein
MADFTFGSFNALKLNYAAAGENKKDFLKLAEIIRDENFDVIAFQETPSDMATKQILFSLGSDWDRRWNSDIHSPSPAMTEGFSFFWNKRRFELLDNNDPLFQAVRGNIDRKPFVGRFRPVNGPFCEFRFIDVHLCNPGNPKEKKYNEYSAVSNLYERVYGNKKESQNRSVYTFILGDYNLTLKQAKQCERERNLFVNAYLGYNAFPLFTGDYDVYEPAKECGFNHNCSDLCPYNSLTTLIMPNTLENAKYNEKVCLFSNDYDHCSYNTQFFEDRDIAINVERVNTLTKYCKESNSSVEKLKQHRNTISDHVPIKISVSLRGRR